MKYFCLMAVIAMMMCSCADDEDWQYGDRQSLANTTWNCQDTAMADGVEAPSATLTLSFTDGSFVLNGRESYASRDTAYVLQGIYEYDHPNLRLIPTDGEPIEAWINVSDGISYIGGVIMPRTHEFKR